MKCELSIVVPIYNGEKFIEAKLRSLSNIQNVDYEVIVVLNKSTDRSDEILESLSELVRNFSVIRQDSFVEAGFNFLSGVKSANGQYIFVSAVDDLCDNSFYRKAIDKLISIRSAVAVAPITFFAENTQALGGITFQLTGPIEERITELSRNIRISHGIFYSLMRRETALELYEAVLHDFHFPGGDWLFNFRLAILGEVYREQTCKCIFGIKGISRGVNSLWRPKDKSIRKILPYGHLVSRLIGLSKSQKMSVKLIFFRFCLRLIKGNIHRYLFYLVRIVKPSSRSGSE